MRIRAITFILELYVNFLYMYTKLTIGKTFLRRREELDKLICIRLERRNLFNLADNSGVSMENRQP